MRIIVQKYGGSSVADLDKLRAVARRIAATRADGTGVVAVVSAMGNTTNELLALARRVTPEPDRRELDMLISVGERIAVALLAMALRELGVAARSLTGSQSGIITDEAHAGASVVEVRPDRLRAVLEAGEVALVAGFQGVSREREVTTLGRGGTDTTAVVLAAALGAEHCEICSDVDGVWSADPRVVAEATRADDLQLDEALALARGGAKVLFEDALRYARDHGVTIRATTTFGPGAGTRIAVDAAPATGAAAVTGDAQLARIEADDLDRVAATLQGSGARLRHRVGSALIVDVRNVHGELDGAVPTATVTAVGSGLGQRVTAVAEAEAGLREAGIAWGSSGAGGDAVWFEVGVGEVDEAVRVLHSVLVRA